MTGVLCSCGGVTGGAAPARIWKAFLDATLEGDPVEQFPPAAGVGTVPTPSLSVTPSASASTSPSGRPSASPSPSATPLGRLVLPTQDPEQPAPAQPVEQGQQQPPSPQPEPETYAEPDAHDEPAVQEPVLAEPGDGSVDEDSAPTEQPRGRGRKER